MGVMIQKITPELRAKLNLLNENGALVSDVVSGSPADQSGIKRGDVIVAFNGRPIREGRELSFIVASTPVGKTVSVQLIRKKEKKDVQVTVGELKPPVEETQLGSESEHGLGMTLEEITPELAQQYDLPVSSGLIIVKVESDSPADDADLRNGDIILEVDQKPVKRLATFISIIRGYKKGDTVLFLINREGATHFVTLTIS
jgi:serine protease Do